MDDESELISMWVAPEARGKAVGATLIDAILEWARQQPVLWVALNVREHNTRAINLYARLGFVDAGLSPHSDPNAPERRMLRLLGK